MLPHKKVGPELLYLKQIVLHILFRKAAYLKFLKETYFRYVDKKRKKGDKELRSDMDHTKNEVYTLPFLQ